VSVVEEESKNPNLVVFDLDGTLTPSRSVWHFIHQKLGTWEGRGEVHLRDWLDGKIDYEEFARVDALEWQGRPIDEIRAIAAEIPILPGAAEVIDFLKARGDAIAIVSSGLDILAGRVADELGVAKHYANKLKTDVDGLLTGEVKINVPAERNDEFRLDGKGKILRDIQDATGINLDDTIAIGDSDSDIPMFLRAGTSYAVNDASDAARAAANFYAPDLFRLKELLETPPEIKNPLFEF
jgi:phosphoserine phosphatase